MVTTKRRITNEQDRFGGYGIQVVNKTMADESPIDTFVSAPSDRYSFRTVTDEPTYTTDNVSEYVTEQKPAYSEPQIRYSQPSVIEYSSRPQVTDYDFLIPPARAKKSRKREREDVMPSIRTRAYAQPEEKMEAERASQEKARLSGKTKAMLFAYIAGILMLAVMVIATGLAVSNINAKADLMENEIAAKNAQLIEQNAEILRLTDTDRITGAAVNNGMQKIESSVEVSLLPTTEPMQYEGRTNWFDKFCDFLSKIIGG